MAGVNVAFVAIASALAGAKLQDIMKSLLDRRADADGDRRTKKKIPISPSSSSPPRTPSKAPTVASLRSPRELDPPKPPAPPSSSSSSELSVVCPRCDAPATPPLSRRGVGKKKPDPFSAEGRRDYLSWDDYFMSVAFLSAQRSKDPNKQVGAVIVGADKVISGVGYNGFPRGCSDRSLPWAKRSPTDDPMETKYAYVCHAEMNAIMNKNSQSLNGATMYVTMYPCNECSKLIIQSGITEVVYFEGKLAIDAAAGDNAAATSDSSSSLSALPENVRGDAATDAAAGATPAPSTPLGKENEAGKESSSGAADKRKNVREEEEKISTPTKGGMQANPTYAAASKLLALAKVVVRQHTPRAVVDVSYD